MSSIWLLVIQQAAPVLGLPPMNVMVAVAAVAACAVVLTQPGGRAQRRPAAAPAPITRKPITRKPITREPITREDVR